MVRKYVRKANPQPGKGGGQPRRAEVEAEKVERALKLVAEGMTPEEAGEREGLVPRTLRRELDRRRKAQQAATTTDSPVPPPPTDKPPSTPPRVPVVAEQAPEGLSIRARRNWYVEHQIANLRTALALAQRDVDAGNPAALSRLGALNEQLRKWLDDLERLAPPEQADPHAEEKRWQVAADEAVAKIKAGVVEARRKAATLLGRPFPTDADVVSRG